MTQRGASYLVGLHMFLSLNIEVQVHINVHVHCCGAALDRLVGLEVSLTGVGVAPDATANGMDG
jgi:hypothetical protein